MTVTDRQTFIELEPFEKKRNARERVTEREKWNRRGNNRGCKMLRHEMKEIQFRKGLVEK